MGVYGEIEIEGENLGHSIEMRIETKELVVFN